MNVFAAPRAPHGNFYNLSGLGKFIPNSGFGRRVAITWELLSISSGLKDKKTPSWCALRAPHNDMAKTYQYWTGSYLSVVTSPLPRCHMGHIMADLMGRPRGIPGEYFLSFMPHEILNSSYVIVNLRPNPLFGIHFPRSLKL